MAKILLIRHAESIDDLTDQYGGWSDFGLTPHGRHQCEEVVSKLRELDVDFEQVLHSPLSRAKESAYIIGSGLRIRVSELIWLKEKNGYGLLTGLTRAEAQIKHPELVNDMKSGYVSGAEPEEMFVERVKRAYEILVSLDMNIVAVTHGGFLSQLFEHVFKKKYIKAHDTGYVLLDTATMQIETSDSFEFKN